MVCGIALLIAAAVAVVVALCNCQQPSTPPEVLAAQTPAEVRVKAVERKSATVARANAATASSALTNTVYSDGTSTVSMAYDRTAISPRRIWYNTRQ